MWLSVGQKMRAVIAFAMVAALLAGSMVAPGSAVAQAQSVQSQLTGVNITYGPPYVMEGDASYTEDVLETIMFVGSADILAMGFMSPLIDLNDGRDIMLESLFGELGTTATIDRGDYTGVSYSLDMLNFEGQEMGVFSLFMNQRSHGFAEFYIFIAPPSLFTATMQTAQNTFAIDGTPLMDGVDATTMGNMVTANVGITGGTAVTDVTEVTDQADTQDTNTTETTATETADSGNGAAYLQTLVDQRAEYMDSFVLFATNLSVFGDDASTDQQKQDAIQAMTDQAVYWSGFNVRAAGVVAPAGFEDVHATYLTWSDEITTMGGLWMGFIQQEGPTSEQFFDQLDVVTAVDLEFADVLTAAANAETGSGTDTNTSETVGTESTGTDTATTESDSSSRTSRTTGTSSSDDTTESTTTDTGSSRTSRTTGTSSSDDTTESTTTDTGSSRTSRTTGTSSSDDDATGTDTGSSRTSRSTDTTSTDDDADTSTENTSSRTSRTTSNTGDTTGGNTSETKGNSRVSSSSADNEWHMEVHDLTITWTDDFMLSETAEVPQSSDAESGEDKISLQYETSIGPVRFTVTVLDNSTLDSTSLIVGLTANDADLKELFGEDAVVIDSEVTTDASAMLVQTADEQGEYFVYVQMTCVTADCSSIAMFLMVAEDAALVEGLTATDSGVAIDDIPLSNVIPVADVEDAVGGR